MIPQQLSSCLDANCNKMLSTLLGLHSLLSNEDGWFYRSNADLQLDSHFSQNLVKATLDTLYQAGIINVDCIGKGRGHRSNRIHINFESFKTYQQYSFNDIRNNPDLWIETVPYKNHYSPSYCKEKGKEIGNTIGKGIGKKVTTNTDTTDTSNSSDTKEYNIINIENILDKDKISNETQKMNTTYSSEDLNYYLDNFFIPSKDYSTLLTNTDSFRYWFNEDLDILNDNIKRKLNKDIPIKEMVGLLQERYLMKKAIA